MESRKHRKIRKRSGFQHHLQRHISTDLTSLSYALPSKVFVISQQCHGMVTKTLKHESLKVPNQAIQNSPFFVHIISFCSMPFQFTQRCCKQQGFLYMVQKCPTLSVSISFFLHSFVFICILLHTLLHILAVMNMGVWIILETRISFLLDLFLGGGLLNHMVVLFYSFLRKLSTAFHNG